MHIDDFDYTLPPERIAQYPAERREASRLLVVHRDTGLLEHRHFYDILEYLNPGDALVLNDSRVLPARLLGTKAGTGARAEILLVKRVAGEDTWQALVRPGKRLHPGDRVLCSESPRLEGEILDYSDDGSRLVRFHYEGIFLETLEQVGRMPLPPYIDRESEEADKDRYQTVYSREEGSVAAPTAGLHFTEALLDQAAEKGVRIARVTLHVGIGTFRPVKCENIEDHRMHFEEYALDRENAGIINDTRAKGGRIISVGTTSARTLESIADEEGQVQAGSGSTGIFIYPGYRFKVVDSLITNFHLPKSTLLMLVSAFYDREAILRVYKEAVDREYRFFSYGDAMILI